MSPPSGMTGDITWGTAVTVIHERAEGKWRDMKGVTEGGWIFVTEGGGM